MDLNTFYINEEQFSLKVDNDNDLICNINRDY